MRSTHTKIQWAARGVWLGSAVLLLQGFFAGCGGGDDGGTSSTSATGATSGAGGATSTSASSTGGGGESSTSQGGGGSTSTTGQGGAAVGGGGPGGSGQGGSGQGGSGQGGSGQGGSGQGGSGQGGSSMVCNPGDTTTCYTGPAGTFNIGSCKTGLATCAADGSGFGPCMGEVLPAAEVCGNAIDEDCSGADLICVGAPLWNKRFGDAAEQRGTAIDLDAQNNIVIVGRATGTVDFGGGGLTCLTNSDMYYAKYDPNGAYLGAKVFGTAGSHDALDVAVDNAGGIIIVGRIAGTIDFGGGTLTAVGASNDAVLVKLTSAGAHVFSKVFGDDQDQAIHAVAVDAANNIFVTGRMVGTADFGGGVLTSAGLRDIFVAKFDSAGNHVWSKRFGAAADDTPNDLTVDGAGNVYVVGNFNGTVDFGGGALIGTGGMEAFIAKFDTNGNHLWSKRFGDAADQTITAVAAAGANVVVSGVAQGVIDFGGGALTSAGNYDVVLAKFNGMGTYQWQKIFGDASDQIARGVSIDAGGNIAVSGRFNGAIDFGAGNIPSLGNSDTFVAKFQTNGQLIFTNTGGDPSDQVASNVIIDSLGNTVAVGSFTSTVGFGLGTLASAGLNDIFLVKFGP